MPSDLTINKLKGTTTPAASTREQRIAASHRKASEAQSQNQVLEDLLRPYREEQENRNRAIAAGFLGAPMDVVQFAANRFAEALVAKKPEVPYTTEDLRERWGVEGAEWSTLLAGLASPDPVSDVGAVGKALILPMGYVRKAGKKADELYQAAKKMFANGEDPVQIYRATGAFKLKGDEILWHKRDTGYIEPEHVRNIIDKQGLKLAEGEEGFITVRPHELLQGDDEVFEMFPFLKNVTVRLHVKNRGTLENPSYIYRNDAQALTGTRGQADIIKGEIDLFNAGQENKTWQEAAASTLYHEIGHIIDAVGGVLPTGGSHSYVTSRYKQLQMAKASRELFDDLKKERVIDDWENADEEDAEFLTQLIDKYDLTPDDMRDLRQMYYRYADALYDLEHEVVHLMDTITNSGISTNTTSLGIVMQEMGADFPLEKLDMETALQLSSDRYYRLEGEARQRLNQYMYDKRDSEIKGFFERVAAGKAPEGMVQPVDPADMILEKPKTVDPRKFTGAN